MKHDRAGNAARFLEAAPDAMIVVDANGSIAVVNFGAEQLFGYARAELVGRPIEMLVPEASLAAHAGHRERYMVEPTTRPMGSFADFMGRRKDGSLVPVEISLSPVADDDGVFVVAAVRDVTARRAAEQNLKDSEERLAAAARGANVGLWDVGYVGATVMVNPIFESQLGYAPLTLRETDGKWAPLRGGLQGWVALLHPDDRDRVAALIEEFLAGRAEVYQAEQRVRRPDGSYSWILSVGNTLARDAEGRPLRVNGVHIDITDMKQRYEELQRLQKLRDGLVHMIVHDLRSPLTSVMGYLDLLRSDPKAPVADALVDEAYLGAAQMAEMISSLLDISRLEAGEMPVERQLVDMREVTAEAMRLLGGISIGRTISHETPHGAVPSNCDAALIRRVVGNLVGNALKFTPASGSITVTVTRMSDRTRVEVADTGPGMPADFLPRVFDKFAQGPEGLARKRYSSGLGLTFCKLAVEAHGGTIGVTSEVGAGSRFWFELPA